MCLSGKSTCQERDLKRCLKEKQTHREREETGNVTQDTLTKANRTRMKKRGRTYQIDKRPSGVAVL